MRDASKIQFRPVNRCIYCGSLDALGREHIVPAGLGGTMTLPKASCTECAKITGSLERQLLRGMLWPLRIVRRFRLKESARAPKSFPVIAVRDGAEEVVWLPFEKYPVVIHMPIFALPELAGGAPVVKGITLTGNTSFNFGPDHQAVASTLKADAVKWRQVSEPAALARVLAKIAYSYAAAELGLDAFSATPVVDAILGNSDTIGRYVGTHEIAPVKQEGRLHTLALQYDTDSDMLSVLVHLFADSRFPIYVVVIGRLKAPPSSAA